MAKIKLIRSPRRSLALQVKNGELVVRSPLGLNESKIIDFINNKSRWLIKKLNFQKQVLENQINLTPYQIWLFGAIYTHHQMIDEKLQLSIYRTELENYVSTKITEITQKVKIKFGNLQSNNRLSEQFIPNQKPQLFSLNQIKFRNNSGRWGSCNNQGVITFSLRLAKQPKPVIDYVIVHELSHLWQMNHSQLFWQQVNTISSAINLDWRTARKELKNQVFG